MAALTVGLVLPSMLQAQVSEHMPSFSLHRPRRKKNCSMSPVARLFGPAIFEASKLKVVYLGFDEKNDNHPGKLPRTYTLTHSDITAKLTLAISQTINNSQLQGWYNRLQRDEVVAEWKKIKGKMSLHVHCHISGGHVLLDLFAKLRFYIFSKELPVVLKAFFHGDEFLFRYYPELQDGLVWVYFHSNIPEFNKVECWGPLKEAGCPSIGTYNHQNTLLVSNKQVDSPKPCQKRCTCCFPTGSLIPWAKSFGNGTDGIISLAIEQQNVASGES